MKLSEQVIEHVKVLEAEILEAAKRFENETGIFVEFCSFEHSRSICPPSELVSAHVDLELHPRQP